MAIRNPFNLRNLPKISFGKATGRDNLPKGRFALKYRGDQCLNCGHELDHSDRYCPNCSQINSTKKLTLRDFLDELLSSLINWDSRLIRTLQALLLKPGKISRDYIDGKRIRYTNPFKFMLSTAIIYFLLIAITTDLRQFDRVRDTIRRSGGEPEVAETEPSYTRSVNLGAPPELEKEIQQISRENQGNTDSIKKNLNERINASEGAAGPGPIVLEFGDREDYESGEAGRGEMEIRDSLILNNPRKYILDTEADKARANRVFKKTYFFWKTLDEDYIDDYSDAVDKYNISDSEENHFTFRSAVGVQRALAQPSIFAAELLSKLPFVIFIFIPFFTVFVYAVYIRKNYTYTEHLIFSFHNQSLLFILLILSVAVDQVLGWSTMGLALMIFGIYLYKAMRKFYGQNRFKTLLKYSFLNTVFGALALLFTLLLFLGSLITY